MNVKTSKIMMKCIGATLLGDGICRQLLLKFHFVINKKIYEKNDEQNVGHCRHRCIVYVKFASP